MGATEILLRLLRQDDNSADLYPCLAYDLLALNFPERRWRECKQLSETQKQILRCLVMADAVWTSTPRLWFLVPNGAQKMSTITGSDIEAVRDEMRSRLE